MVEEVLASILQWIFGEDPIIPGLGWSCELSLERFFESILEAKDAILNILPSAEYLLSVFLRTAVFIPYVIYSEFKQYKYEKRIYELTWTLSYHLKKNMFHVVPQWSKTDVRRSRSCIVKNTEFISSTSATSASSSPGRLRRRSTIIHMGDMLNGTRIHKVKSSPVLMSHGKGKSKKPVVNLMELVHAGESHKQHVDTTKLVGMKSDESTQIEETSSEPVRPTKKLKKETDDNSRFTPGSNTMYMRIWRKPPEPMRQTIIVEYCNVLSDKGATKHPSLISQNTSTSMGSASQTKRCTLEPYDSSSRELKNIRLEDSERKWRSVIERNINTRNERVAKLKEMELKKQEEKEMARKEAMMRRRAMIARIREQNRKLLVEQKGTKLAENYEGDEVVLPLARVKPVNCSSQQRIDAAELQHGPTPSVGDLAGLKPVIRVMQRTFTIEHAARMSKVANSTEYNVVETKTLRIGDVETKPTDAEIHYDFKKTAERNLPKSSEYYLLTQGIPPKPNAYVKKFSSSAPSDLSLANRSISSNSTRPITKFGDEVSQVSSSLQTISKKSDCLFQSSPAYQHKEFEAKMQFPNDESLSAVTAGSKPRAVMTRTSDLVRDRLSKLKKLSSGSSHSSSRTVVDASSSDFQDGTCIQEPSSEKTKESKLSVMNTKVPEPPSPPCQYDVEAPPPRRYDVEAPPSPTFGVDSKPRRPFIKIAKRRLQKELDKATDAKSKTQHPEPSKVSDPVSSAAAKTKVLGKLKNQNKPKPQDVKCAATKSLVLKKIELRKRLEERRAAITCPNPAINDLTSTGKGKCENDSHSLDDVWPISAENLIDKPITVKKPRRFSLDGKLSQSRTLANNRINRFKKCTGRKSSPTITVMKKGNSKPLAIQKDQASVGREGKKPGVQEKPKLSSPTARVNYGVAGTNGSQSPMPASGVDVLTTVDGTHCRKKMGGSPDKRQGKHTAACIETKAGKSNPNENQLAVANDLITNLNLKSEKVGKSQESFSTGSSHFYDNPQFVSSPASVIEGSTPPRELITEMKQLSKSRAEEKIDTVTAGGSGAKKRSDFLAFQMDESGHPVPVNHTKASSDVPVI